MRQAVTQAKKANRHCPAPYYSMIYNAPVAVRRMHGFYGADHAVYDHLHGVMGDHVAPVQTNTEGAVNPVERKSLLKRIWEFIKGLFRK